jgi:hypothetical protein
MNEHHDHGAHAPIVSRETPGEWEILEIAVRELAIAKGLITADDLRSERDSLRTAQWPSSSASTTTTART